MKLIDIITGLALIYSGYITGNLLVTMILFVILFAVIPYIVDFIILNKMANSIGIQRFFCESNEAFRLRIIKILSEKAKLNIINNNKNSEYFNAK